MIILIVFLLVFLTVTSCGVVFLYIWAENWPCVSGVINSNHINQINTNNRVYYDHIINYSYKYNGKEFESNSITLLGLRLYKSEGEAKRIIGDNNSISVYVCPIKPSIAYLYQDKRVLWGGILVAISSALLAWALLQHETVLHML